MMYIAARHGQRAICKFARELLGSSADIVTYDRALRGAALGGYKKLCLLICSWGAHNLIDAYNFARGNGYYELCILLAEVAANKCALSMSREYGIDRSVVMKQCRTAFIARFRANADARRRAEEEARVTREKRGGFLY